MLLSSEIDVSCQAVIYFIEKCARIVVHDYVTQERDGFVGWMSALQSCVADSLHKESTNQTGNSELSELRKLHEDISWTVYVR